MTKLLATVLLLGMVAGAYYLHRPRMVGKIDAWAVYKKPLSKSAIVKVYEAGPPKKESQ